MKRSLAILAALLLFLAGPVLADLDFRWSPLPPLPAPRSNGALVALERDLYFLGGNGPGGASASCWRLESGGRWRPLPDLPGPRYTHGAAVVDGRIFVVGGLGADGQPLARVDIYDPQAGLWQPGPSLAAPRSRLAVAAVDGHLVAAGGCEAEAPASERVEILDPGAESWTVGPSLPLGLSRLGAVPFGHDVVVAGGETSQGEPSARVFRLRVGAWAEGRPLREVRRWDEGPPLRQARKNFAMAVLGRQVVVAGGWLRPGQFLASVESGDPAAGWNYLPPLPQALDGLRAAGLDGRACLAGGYDGAPRQVVQQGAWRGRHSAWRVDRRSGFHLAWHDETDRPGRSAVPLLSAPWKADITNISMTGLRDLGFPVSDPAPEGRNFYLKFFACPSGIDPVVSARRAMAPLLVLQMAGAPEIEATLARPGGVVVKKGVVALAGDPFSPAHPFPPCCVPTGPGAQEEFDLRTPFTSLYVQPATPIGASLEGASAPGRQGGAAASCPRTLAGTPAAGSADGVLAFHCELLDLLARTWPEVEGPDPQRFRTFQDLSQPGRTVLIRVLRQPLVFQNFRELPMPEDPKRVFLTGLLLVYRDVYAGQPGQSPPLDSRVFEVGSVVRL